MSGVDFVLDRIATRALQRSIIYYLRQDVAPDAEWQSVGCDCESCVALRRALTRGVPVWLDKTLRDFECSLHAMWECSSILGKDRDAKTGNWQMDCTWCVLMHPAVREDQIDYQHERVGLTPDWHAPNESGLRSLLQSQDAEVWMLSCFVEVTPDGTAV